jgi:hypothetical protein
LRGNEILPYLFVGLCYSIIGPYINTISFLHACICDTPIFCDIWLVHPWSVSYHINFLHGEDLQPYLFFFKFKHGNEIHPYIFGWNMLLNKQYLKPYLFWCIYQWYTYILRDIINSSMSASYHIIFVHGDLIHIFLICFWSPNKWPLLRPMSSYVSFEVQYIGDAFIEKSHFTLDATWCLYLVCYILSFSSFQTSFAKLNHANIVTRLRR